MELEDTLSSCSDSDEQDVQQMLKRAKILKDSCLNGLSALKSNFTWKHEQGITKSEFERAFSHIFGEDVDTFTRTSIEEGPFSDGGHRVIVAEGTEGSLHLGPERPRVYSDLSQDEKDRYNADIRATNIILQGLPKDIYSLINHYTDAKDIWDNVKMLLEGSELTKEDRESQLYDDFEHFRQNKGETIHDYYVRFAKLINDMRNIKMTMSKIQLNSKFVNNMLPEWGRFVTAVKT
ncbi:hypothetical protein Tco_0774732 [Tanacetum coccineum]|uniref:Integrase, catalytic region, zinc finger, CCHC-type, peptidase aspartic, catalytic n=1 Tax=Tanacetum coccineum TaxID=301880 RepID=A0ABQ4ZRK8_9ASTR